MSNKSKTFAGVLVTLLTCVFIYTSLGSLLSLILLYLRDWLHIPSELAIAFNSAFLALVYSSSIIGGYLGGKYSYKNTVICEALIGFIGLPAVAIPKKAFVDFGLALFIISYGFTIPNIMCFLGQIFEKDDPLRASSFTSAYVAMNLGAIFSMISGGYLSEYLSYKFAFVLFSVFLLLALIIFLFGYRYYNFLPGTTSYLQQKNNPKCKGIIPAIIFTIISTPVLMFFLYFSELSNYFIIVVGVGVFIWAFMLAGKADTAEGKKGIRLYLTLLLISVVFWILYMLQPSTITIFILTNVNKNLFGLLIPTASFYSLNPIFIIILGAVFSAYCAKSKIYSQIPTIYKFVLGIIITGLGYLILGPAILTANSLGFIAAGWIVLAYFIQTSGEIVIGPTAFAMVGELVPTKFEGIMMGLRQVTMGLGGALSMFVADLALGDSKKYHGPLDSNPHYLHTFLTIGGITALIGVLVFVVAFIFIKRKSTA